jgi:hypothetical protein
VIVAGTETPRCERSHAVGAHVAEDRVFFPHWARLPAARCISWVAAGGPLCGAGRSLLG